MIPDEQSIEIKFNNFWLIASSCIWVDIDFTGACTFFLSNAYTGLGTDSSVATSDYQIPTCSSGMMMIVLSY